MTRALAALLVLGACGAPQHRFPLRSPMWVDDDRRSFAGQPAETGTSAQWDRIDHTIFRQLSELWLYERDREAINVNSMDEVPSSSWFTNRIGFSQVSAERLARGACGASPEPPRPWTVTRAKTSGSSPGLFIRAADGQRFLFKVDFDLPERGTAADSIGTRIFWAAGFNTPCNRVVFFEHAELLLAATEDAPSREDVDEVLATAIRLEDGRIRGSLSRFIEGTPLGDWQFWGVRPDDPNDVIPHEQRREVRGMYVLSAWLNHIDTRSENNIDTWIETGDGRGYVRHYVLDVGDSFGQIFPMSMILSQSFGLSHYLDFQHMMEDFITLGIAERPWYGAERGPAADVLGFYDVERFDPNDWRNGYPNPAFERASERDKAWMARIIARFSEEHIRAVVAMGRFSRQETTDELVRILLGRQRRLLERYLTRLSPLTFPETRGNRLCLRDLALESGLREDRRYAALAYPGWPTTERVVPLRAERDGTRACVELPSQPDEEYWVVDVLARSEGHEPTGPARVHLYALGAGGYRAVGLERPDR